MTGQVIVEGPPLKPIWLPYTNAPGNLAEGQFQGRIVHALEAGAAPNPPTPLRDGVADLICQGLRYESGTPFRFSTWITQIAGPLKIYSIYKGQNPFLCFSARLAFDFNTEASLGTVVISNVDDLSFSIGLTASVSGISMNFGSTVIPFPNNVMSSLVQELTSSRLLTRKFAFYIAAKRLTKNVVGTKAEYEVKAFVQVRNAPVEIWSTTLTARFRDRFKAEFRCTTEL